MRSGTFDTPSIAGFAAAATEAAETRASARGDVGALRDELIAGVLEQVPDARLNGDPRLDAVHGCLATRTCRSRAAKVTRC